MSVWIVATRHGAAMRPERCPPTRLTGLVRFTNFLKNSDLSASKVMNRKVCLTAFQVFYKGPHSLFKLFLLPPSQMDD